MDHDERFDILRNSIRRQIIAVLHEKDEIGRNRLVDILAAAEADAEADIQPRRIRLKLHHNHLPRLADAGVIEYDEETVTPTDQLESVAQMLPLGNIDQTSVQV